METNTQIRLANLATDLQKVIDGASALTDQAIRAQQAVNQLNVDIKNAELKAQLARAEAEEVERWKAKQAQINPNAPLMERLFPTKGQTTAAPMMPGTAPLTVTNPVVVDAKPKNLTNEARALIQTGHSYERAVSKLQAKYPNHPADNVRRAVGRARDGR